MPSERCLGGTVLFKRPKKVSRSQRFTSQFLPKARLHSCLAQYKKKNFKKKKKLSKSRRGILGGNTNQNEAPRVSSWGSDSARTHNTWPHLFTFLLPAPFILLFSSQQSYLPTFTHPRPAAREPLSLIPQPSPEGTYLSSPRPEAALLHCRWL